MVFRFYHFKQNKILAKSNIAQNDFYKSLRIDFIERIKLLKISLERILILDCYDENFVAFLQTEFPNSFLIEDSSDNINVLNFGDFDLVISYFAMHYMNNLNKFLIDIYNLLSNTGVFMTKTLGERNLENLNKLFIALETKYKEPHYIHTIPSIKREVLSQALNNIGYNNIVVDYDTINIKANSPLEFIKMIKASGDGNIIQQKEYCIISNNIYKNFSEPKFFQDKINILNLICSKGENALL